MFSLTYQWQWRLNPYYVDVDSIVDMICALTEKHCWHGTASELLTLLHSMQPTASLPPTPHQLSSLLEMMEVVLEDLVFIDCHTEGGQQIVDLHQVRRAAGQGLAGEGAVGVDG